LSHVDPNELSLLRQRHPEFLEKLFSEVNPYLFKFLASRKILAERAEDLVFDSWSVFFEKLENFQGQSSIRTFITGILINKIHEGDRAARKLQLEEDPEELMNSYFTPDGWWKQPPRNPKNLLAQREASQMIQECLEGLSGSQKDAFLLREYHEEESSEICKILGVTVTHLGVLLHRAKDKLRQCLEGRTSV
jgi:RNA polymerase sigma-70 factor (ECF subfamily)